jgi:hypothetical protein
MFDTLQRELNEFDIIQSLKKSLGLFIYDIHKIAFSNLICHKILIPKFFPRSFSLSIRKF